MTTRSRRRALTAAGDVLLTVLAAAGSLCIVLMIVGWLFDVSLIMFRTGSMSPAIPAGSVAMVREIPATEMEVGDVVTVERGEGVLPVTHRVTALLGTDATTGQVDFEMRGDANAVEDPEPYSAVEVRRVVFSVAGAARVIQWFGNPYVLGSLTLGAATLVIWAFWPREHEASDPADRQDRRADATSSADHAAVVPLLAALVLTAPGVDPDDTGLITGEHLRMQTGGDASLMRNLSPGRPVAWEVGIWADAPDPGVIDLEISGRGELAQTPDALMITVRACARPWTEGRCASGAEVLLHSESLSTISRDATPRHLTSMASDEERWLRVEGTLADVPGAEAATGDVLLHAVGAGEELTVGVDRSSGGDETPEAGGSAIGPDGGLARTGAAGAIPVLVAGLAALAAGTVLRRAGRVSRR